MNVIAIMNHMGFTSKKNPSVNCIVLERPDFRIVYPERP